MAKASLVTCVNCGATASFFLADRGEAVCQKHKPNKSGAAAATCLKLPKITAKQENGDDGFCYVVRVDGREFVNGLTRSEVDYSKRQALKAWMESKLPKKPTLALIFEAKNGAIITNVVPGARLGKGCVYSVLTTYRVGVTVERDSGRLLVDVPPAWHHTDEERCAVVEQAEAAVTEYLKS